MSTRLRRILPWVILVTGLAIPVWLPMMAHMRMSAIQSADTGKSRLFANQAIAQVQALHPGSLEDASLKEAMDKSVHVQYINSLWLFTPDGRIVRQSGCRADPSRFYNWATRDMRAIIINALPKGTLSDDQQGALIAVAALRGVGGGDHNDIFHQVVQPLRSSDGKLLGWIGAIYDAASAGLPAGASLGLKLAVLLTLLLLAVYDGSLAAWVYLDAKSRGERAWVWAIFAVIGNLAALIAYLLVRSPHPGAERNQ